MRGRAGIQQQFCVTAQTVSVESDREVVLGPIAPGPTRTDSLHRSVLQPFSYVLRSTLPHPPYLWFSGLGMVTAESKFGFAGARTKQGQIRDSGSVSQMYWPSRTAAVRFLSGLCRFFVSAYVIETQCLSYDLSPGEIFVPMGV